MATSSTGPEDLDRFEAIAAPSTVDRASSPAARPTTSSSPSTSNVPTTGRARGSSLSNGYIRNTARKFSTSGMPLGFFQASGQVVSSTPSLRDIQNGNLDEDGWSGVGQRRNSVARKEGDGRVLENLALERTKTGKSVSRRYSVARIPEEPEKQALAAPPPERKDDGVGTNRSAVAAEKAPSEGESSTGKEAGPAIPHDPNVPYPNGYQFPPKHTKTQSFNIAMRAYWKFLRTPFGFLLTLYSVNVVAWGAMLFLVLIGGAPAMCHPKIVSCSSKSSTKSVWVENDSQIVNALFCVTGLGLIPWRFRDLYYLLQWRLAKNPLGLRRLAGINRDWYRLEDSQNLDVLWDPKTMETPAGFAETTFAWPVEKSPDPPLTGERAAPTKPWKLDLYIWCYVWNTFFQIMLCGVMWGLNRYTRPAWTTGTIIPVACIVAATGGITTALEGKKVKKIEGVPVSEEDLEILRVMREKDREASGGEAGVTFRESKPREGLRGSIEEGPMGEDGTVR